MFITIEIKNPSNPTINNPMADTFVTIFNSLIEGFLRTDHTLEHCKKNDFILSIIISKLTNWYF